MDAFLEDPHGKRIPLKDGFVIGRVAGCDLVITDSKASRRHAKVHLAGSVAEVEDLESANGTLLNGKPVQRRVLRSGDVITIGTTQLRFEEGATTPSAGAKATEPEELELDFGAPSEPLPASPRAPRPPPVEPSAAPAGDVLEFVDEVVSVRPRDPAPAPAARSGSAGAAAAAKIERRDGVLSFQAQKNAKKGGLLGDDLAQMSLGMRALLTLVGLAVAAGIGYGVMSLVR